jgi:hypothetical protein
LKGRGGTSISLEKYSVDALVYTIDACIKGFARQTRVYKRDMLGLRLDAVMYGFSLIPGKKRGFRPRLRHRNFETVELLFQGG